MASKSQGKKGIKAANSPETDLKTAKELEVLANGQPVETVESKELSPAVQPAEPEPADNEQPALKVLAVAALQEEVSAIANGRALEGVVYRFNKRNGTQSGSSLMYYYQCKLNEIENPDQPCDFTSPAGPPAEALAGAGKSKQLKKEKPKCPNCP